jgi:hypothetical protein
MKMVRMTLAEWVEQHGQAGAARRIGRNQAHVWHMIKRASKPGYTIEIIEVGEGENLVVRVLESFESLVYSEAEGLGKKAKRPSRKKPVRDADVATNDDVIEDKESKESIDIDIYNYVMGQFNNICTTMPRVEVLTDKRKRAIQKVMKLDKRFRKPEVWTKYFRYAMQSDFLAGRKPGVDWRCNFDFLTHPDRWVKVMEGQYHKESA